MGRCYSTSRVGFNMRGAVLFLISFSLGIWGASAQQIQLKDKHNHQPIANAVVLVGGAINSKTAILTDDEGMATLTSFQLPLNIRISHVAYHEHSEDLRDERLTVIWMEPLVRQLGDVVVTGQYEPQSARKSVYQIRTIHAEKIQSRGATRLQDVLNSELNIRFEQDNALGGSNLSMQGLAGQNVKVLIDGIPMTGRQGTSNEININQIDINTIERIEIVEGPMSVMYGADALAGVINIITKKPLEGQVSAHAKLHEETVGKEYGISEGIHNQSLGFSAQRKGWQLSAGGGRNYFGGWQGAAVDRDKEWHIKKQWLGNTSLGYRNDKINTWYRLDILDETITNPGAFEGLQALDQDYISERWMHQWQTNASINSRFSLSSAFSYTNYYRRTLSTTVDKETGDRRLALGAGQQDRVDNDGMMARISGVYKAASWLSLQAGVEVNHETGSGGRIQEGTQKITDLALFVSTEITPHERISVRPGFRMVNNSVYQSPPIIPSLNLKIGLTDGLDFRMAYGRGFRAPSLRELYFNFFDASHSIEGNPDLKAELSHSINGGFSWLQNHRKSLFKSTLNAFYNKIDDMISNGYLNGNTQVTTYINIDQFETKGFNWNNEWSYANRLETSLGFSYVGRYNQYQEQQNDLPNFVWTKEFNSNISWHMPDWGTNLNLFYKYTGKTPFYQIVDAEVMLAESEGFHWADVTINQKIGSAFSLNGGVRNLANITGITSGLVGPDGGHTGGSIKPVGYGRSYFLGISYQFNK